jgi:hypothetical protein
MADYIINVWYGRERLWVTFWFFFIIIPSVIHYFFTLTFAAGNLNLITFNIFYTPVIIVTTIATWRSANNYTGKIIWVYLTKLAIILSVMFSLLSTSLNYLN